MRFLALHVDAFASRVTERGRSKLVEEPTEPEVRVGEALGGPDRVGVLLFGGT